MKKIIILFIVISLVLTADIASQAIDHSEVGITADGPYNMGWEEKISNSTDIAYVKAEALKLNTEYRTRRNDNNAVMLKLFFKASALFLMLSAIMVCFIFYAKKCQPKVYRNIN